MQFQARRCGQMSFCRLFFIPEYSGSMWSLLTQQGGEVFIGGLETSAISSLVFNSDFLEKASQARQKLRRRSKGANNLHKKKSPVLTGRS